MLIDTNTARMQKPRSNYKSARAAANRARSSTALLLHRPRDPPFRGCPRSTRTNMQATASQRDNIIVIKRHIYTALNEYMCI